MKEKIKSTNRAWSQGNIPHVAGGPPSTSRDHAFFLDTIVKVSVLR